MTKKPQRRKNKGLLVAVIALGIILTLELLFVAFCVHSSEADQLGEAVETTVTAFLSDLPWLNGGKMPDEYTWDEFQALGELEQEAFFEWFASAEAFEVWMNREQTEEQTDSVILPEETTEKKTFSWESGGKQPDEYTWDEFQALGELEQEAFFEWFKTPEDFEAWMNSANPVEPTEAEKAPDEPDDGEADSQGPEEEKCPWENGGKLPNEYTWEEYQALDEWEQEAFFEWFGTSAAFEAWIESVMSEDFDNDKSYPVQTEGAETLPETDFYPWENGGKLPNEYTWEEFLALSELEQEAFFEWFETPEDFEAWMNSVNQ